MMSDQLNYFPTISEENVEVKFNKLKKSFNYGSDKILLCFLKNCTKCLPLTKLFNSSLKQGVIPLHKWMSYTEIAKISAILNFLKLSSQIKQLLDLDVSINSFSLLRNFLELGAYSSRSSTWFSIKIS